MLAKLVRLITKYLCIAYNPPHFLHKVIPLLLDQVIQKISENNKIRKISNETKNKIRNKLINKKRSYEIIKKISKPVIQYDKQMNLITEYDSAKTAAQKTNIKRTNISACCKSQRKTAGGYIWKFKKEKDL